MMLNYLYTNFLEEDLFVVANATTRHALNTLINARVFPAPSYVYAGKGRLVSFVSDSADTQEYRFHLKGHTAWFDTVAQRALNTQDQARQHFFDRYEHAKQAFFASDLGQQLSEAATEVHDHFDKDHADATWAHFLNGVYGVCTRDGHPESVFKKQAGVMYVEHLTSGGPASLSRTHLQLLEHAVDFLDTVESDFAPHEVSSTSRQRCILDVRAKFLDQSAA